ncbi:hypothetical protein QFC22_006018 [Naganishia vaughanmartiniae]|uniref:Uncharacterized protein n=1 Tax=Naganishia vaughanmartiniae TaxID=1424756 RepID=A0ACC2WPP4_9TREE|nr:hypothetical protein QFC22_006018 [Naganishia vaughanmartiniae]
MAQRNPSRFEVTDDITQLPSIADDTILACLRERYLNDKPYTSMSAAALISLNPHKHFEANSDTSLVEYANAYWSIDEESLSGREGEDGGWAKGGDSTPPHIFKLAMDAYYHMKRTGTDQAIMINGETGSGKSEARRLSIKAISQLSAVGMGKRPMKMAAQVANGEFILETFGNARTHQTENASRFGKYTELQFSSSGKLVGCKTLTYYLEKARATSPPTGERSFHIFYYMTAGATQEERAHLMLGDSSAYRYLGNRFGHNFDSGRHAHTEEDAARFDQLKEAFKAVGMSKRWVAQVCQLAAAILHLGNIDFEENKGKNEEAAIVRNTDVLETVSEFLGVTTTALEGVLSYKSKLIHKELCTIFLDVEAASANRDELAHTLYSLLFSWLVEHINQKLCRDDFASLIGLLDFPGFQNLSGISSRPNSLDQLCVNYANERLQGFIYDRIMLSRQQEMNEEGLTGLSPPMAFFDNRDCLELLDGIISTTDNLARKPKNSEHDMMKVFQKEHENHSHFKLSGMDRSGYATFTISHYNGPVTYSSEAFLEKDANVLNPDFVQLLRRSPGVESNAKRVPTATLEGGGSTNEFIQQLFESKAVSTEHHPQDNDTIVAAQQPVKPRRAPSTRRKGGRAAKLASVGEEREDADDREDSTAVGGGNDQAPVRGVRCVLGEFRGAMDLLYGALADCQPWFIFCLNPNDAHLPNQVETRGLRASVKSLGFTEIGRKLATSFEVSLTHGEACERYADELNAYGIPHGGVSSSVDAIRSLAQAKHWQERDLAVGNHKVFLSHRAFHSLEDRLRIYEGSTQAGKESGRLGGEDTKEDPFSPYRQSALIMNYQGPFGDNGSHANLPMVSQAREYEELPKEADDGFADNRTLDYDERYTSRYGDTMSYAGTEAYAPSRNMFDNVDTKALINEKDPDKEPLDGEIAEEYRISASRKRWVILVAMLTFFLPHRLLKRIPKFRRDDIRQAWKEKLAINMIIWFICGCAVFVIAILGNLICPTEHVYSTGELAAHNYDDDPNNAYVSIRGEVFDLTTFASTHLSVVPVVPTKSIMKYSGIDATSLFPVQVSALCDGIDGSVSPWVADSATNTSDVNAKYHDFRAYSNDSRPDWYYEQMVYLRYNHRVGFMGYTAKEIKSMAKAGKAVAIYDNLVYDMTTYISQGGGGFKVPDGYAAPSDTSRKYMADPIVSLFQQNAGKDITQLFDNLAGSLGQDVVSRQRTCLRNLFVVGKVDNRNSPQCLFATYILLVLSIIMVSIIGFKFIAAIHFGSTRAPEDHDKFVICQVPCYSEGEDSLRRTIDSLARLKYDDKRKLILVICDGNVTGAGNGKPTPDIVLDILGNPNDDTEKLSFLSLGDGAKQHNMGKVYSGLYECAGHVVPYLVVVKSGKPTEKQKPGNRGKRDSQMVIMHFLNKVHFDAPMNPLELEMYHQIKNVIGVNPTFYEYIFTVDADTTVEEYALNRLVSAMVHDKKIIAACGETELANPKKTIITMMQVYEYFISHHLAKSFESLFNSITCLPGCFSIYRLRTPDTHKPLFISNQIIHDYSENRVDTLHLKNLLLLGEDRYLTTLILKHFPTYKTKFVRDAHAYTVAPDDYKVLLSQRRRWINSTIHNLVELTGIEGLCGFCCFSMRAVVFVDLLSTIIAPVTVAYIVYLLYLVIGEGKTIPVLSIVLLAAIYGLQALIFIFRLRWDMIAWMMDDFSWGATRVLAGQKGKVILVHDEGKFDPKSIPEKTWRDYENELWDNDADNHSLNSYAQEKQQYEGSQVPSFHDYERGYGGSQHMGSRPSSGFGQNRFASYRGDEASLHGASGPGSARQSAHLPVVGVYDRGSSYGAYTQMPGDPLTGVPAMVKSESQQRFTVPPSLHHQDSSAPLLPDYAPAQPITLGASAISDQDLEQEIRDICRAADLDQLTKKGVRRELERRFNTDLGSRKETINMLIAHVLSDFDNV